MTRFVLDTDIVSRLQRGDPAIAQRLADYPPEDVFTTIITVEEQLSGWYTLLRRARRATELVPVYERMTETVRFLRNVPILSFTRASAETYEELRARFPRRGRMDLRIAAIAISHGAVLVTRNLRDFLEIDELTVEDWT
jgi:tRNA(fMet)-specific endonuclease VapC